MAIDFPASPTVGQTFVVGSVTYTWDGVKWTAEAAAGGGGLWDRTGTDLSPKTDGDSLQLKDGTGTTKVDLNANGSAAFNNPLGGGAEDAGVNISPTGSLFCKRAGSGSNTGTAFSIDYGTTTTASIHADGSATFASAVRAVSAAGAAGGYRHSQTDSGYYLQDDAGSSSIVLYKDGSATFAGKVGIGTAAPANDLDVVKTAAGAVTTARIGSVGSTGANNATLILNSGGTGSSELRFDYETSTNYASIGSTTSSKNLVFSTDAQPRATIDSSGRLLVGAQSSSNTSRLEVMGNAATSSGTGSLYLMRGNDAIGSGVGIGEMLFTNKNGQMGAMLNAASDAAWTLGSSHPTRLVFLTAPSGSASPVERMRIASGGAIILGNGVPSAHGTLTVYPNDSNGAALADWTRADTTSSSTAARFRNGSTIVGVISYTNTATTYATSSDYRLKENVVPLTGAADRVKQLKPSKFNFIADPDKTVDGFIAHEAQAVVPECATGTKDEVDNEGKPVYQGIDQSKLVPLLTGALQEALTRIEQLEAKVTALEGK